MQTTYTHVHAAEIPALLQETDTHLIRVASSLALADGVFDLRDLQQALSERHGLPEHVTLPMARYVEQPTPLHLDDLRLMLTRLPADPAIEAKKASGKPKPLAPGHSRVAEVELTFRVYLPDDLDHEDEDAVDAWIDDNWHRVMEAAGDADHNDAHVADVYEVNAKHRRVRTQGARA